jgi:type IV pilus assembly protein PilY1
VKAEDYGYANASVPGRSSYVAYVASKADRIPMIYVGANDGMLHGFRADIGSTTSGRELMAHVPAVVFDRLNRLMDPSYGHASYVDGQLAAGDAYIGGNWKTVLVGGLGAGGRSIYAIDISDPLGHGPSKVMWEFTDPDLGYTFSQPQIGHLRSGHWVAVFGNGYNSATTNEKAWLFVVDLSNGTLLRKIQAGGPAAVNGLSTPALIDTNGDRILDYAYAGDLQGNLWKFDLTGDAPSAWGLANGGLKLIQAVNAAGGGQPITVKPSLAIATKLAAGGVMVYFGSGQYLNSTDIDNTAVQTFYAVWDNGAPGTVTRSQLRSQTIDAETRQFGYDLRQTSNNTVDYATQRGWFVDLQLAGSGANGERVIAPALLRYDRVIFMTTIPSRDVCVAGGSSWLMELDAYNGARGAPSFFDLNLDGAYTAADLLASGNAASGVKSPIGIARTPVWLEQGRSSETAFKQLSGSTGGTFALRNRKPAILGSVRRVFWQQIQ